MPDSLTTRAPRRVLLVEDESETREALREILAMNGYAVRTAANGREALDLLRAGEAPDVIVFDLRMPVMDGWSFRAQLKLEPRFARTPVIAMSADGTAQAAAIDAAQFLSKPF